MEHIETLIKKYADELVKALHTDLNKACKILTKIFKYVKIGDLQDLFEKLNEQEGDYSLINDCFNCANTLLMGTRPGTADAYLRISNIMETLHYNNGFPLTGYNFPEENPTEWNDYFEHYDRDQDLWGFYWDCEVYNFCTDGKEIYMRINYSLSELKRDLKDNYDGADWHHDFMGY